MSETRTEMYQTVRKTLEEADGPRKARDPQHDTGCGCHHCTISFEPMAALLHRRYTTDTGSIRPYPLEGKYERTTD